jgi:hypothetical protein
MTLRDLLDWMWNGDGTWYVQGFQNAWQVLDNRQAATSPSGTNGHIPGAVGPRRADGHPVTPEPAAPPSGAPAWRGGPCDPLCEFEDDGLRLIGYG